MSKRSLTRLFIVILALLTTTAFASKNEVVYVNLSCAGDAAGVWVVNRFESDRATDVIDYGDYSSVVNLTDLKQIKQKGDEVSFSMPSGTFYYQGNAFTRDIPWLFRIDYKLDGKPVSPDELAGKSGRVEIGISITKNDKVNEVFFDNYMLSMSCTLSGDIFSNIEAPDATIANSGKDKLLTYTILPGSEKTYSVTMDAKGFELGAISMNGVPFGLDIGDVDTSDIKDKLGDLRSGIRSVDKGAAQLHTATQKLYDGANDLYTGSVSISGGISSLKSGSAQLASGTAEISKGLNSFASAYGQLKSQAQALKAGGSDLRKGAQELTNGFSALETAFDAISSGSSAFSQGISSLVNAAGSCDDEIALVNALLAKGAGNADVRTYLSKEMAAMTKIIMTLEGLDDGLSQLASSNQAFIAALGEVEKGLDKLRPASNALCEPLINYTNSVGKLSDAMSGIDVAPLAENFATFDSGVKSLDSSLSTLKDSYQALQSGIKTVYEGAGKLQTGTKKLDSGAGELKSETKNMDKTVGDEVDKALSKYTGDGFEPLSFMDERNDVELVQFVIKTPQIEVEQPNSTDEEAEKPPETFIDRLWALFR